MAEVKILLVPLHRCRECNARMFERDRLGHLERHGISLSDDELSMYFRAGKKDTPALVGGNYRPLRRPKKKSKSKQPAKEKQ